MLANKITELRKKSGWSQEELAEQMDVTRQSVSKWESAQSVPDLDKIVKLSSIFGVSTDYLIKDEIEVPCSEDKNSDNSTRKLTMNDANEFLNISQTSSKRIALGVLLCILSPVFLILLCGLSESTLLGISGNFACGIGLAFLLIFVAVAVGIFINTGSKTEDYQYLEDEYFETEYGVTNMVNELKAKYKSTNTKKNATGVILIILSVIPLCSGSVLSENQLILTLLLCFMFIPLSIGVYFLTQTGIIWSSYNKILQEGDYTRENKANSHFIRVITSSYWFIATAVYLLWSFISGNWGFTWIIWPIAGIVFPVVVILLKSVIKQK